MNPKFRQAILKVIQKLIVERSIIIEEKAENIVLNYKILRVFKII
ncbi:7910_t:CDS:2 [Funneliformis geosporum]|uniref:7910_t:CDS:1 n=1 Tax=Funneliformis geosporum TaxID=1117311 RepID=A0A9W4WRN6_9GLOM|nr:7910_t:CDS:2 [Funneliformis geosporum]